MSLVGKKFPSITVDAISEMGDNLKINIFYVIKHLKLECNRLLLSILLAKIFNIE